MKKLFGTDGIRGVAGQFPLDPTTIHAVGLALAHHLGDSPRVLIGQDTRESSCWIAAALTAGLAAGGATVDSAGVIPTPAVAYLARAHKLSAGVVISASHNPWVDNGIKLFGPDGYKLPDKTELAIEAEIFRRLESSTGNGQRTTENGLAINDADRAEYIRSLLSAVPNLSLDGQRIVIDCANGAACAIAPQLFAELNGNGGGEVILTHASPSGRNINEQCGALYPTTVAAEVVQQNATMGITFDGDADRAMFADENGKVVNGDAVLLLAARDLAARGLLTNSTVVATTMSNMGLEAALSRSGIKMIRAPVGDKYVLEQMLAAGAALGGEQSGHIIFSGRSTTGDGLLTALLLLDIIHRAGKTLAQLTADLKTFPQIIVNVRVREKRPLDLIPAVLEAIEEAEAELARSGRVVIRYSGTEPLARIMIEAESEALMNRHAQAIANAIRDALGEQQRGSREHQRGSREQQRGSREHQRGSSMTKRETLEKSNFGRRIAEEETDDLKQYFVQTEQWKRLLAGDIDIIYGPKGSGKSALYSLLTREFETMRRERRIIGIPAEDPRGTPVFRDLVNDPPASEEVFRQLWKFYFLSLLAEYARDYMKLTNVRDKEAEDTVAILVRVGLMEEEKYPSLKGVLKRVLNFITSRPISVEGSIRTDPTGSSALAAMITFGEPTNEQRRLGFISSDEAFGKLSGFLRKQDQTVWLMLDRLDVAFAENSTLEKNALRALFRTYLDLISYESIAIKIFLRDDIWRRIVAEGFREASHITRALTISWDEKSLLNLIVRRAIYNHEICEFYKIQSKEILADTNKQRNFFHKMFPYQIAIQRRHTNTLDWILSRVQDGYQSPAPREVIHLLQEARNQQLREYQVGGSEPPGDALIGQGAIKDSLPEISKVRFEQTLCAEYPTLRDKWMKMENGKTSYTLKSLSRLFEVTEEQASSIAEQMVEAGFFAKETKKGVLIYWVPFIYRDALQLTQGAAE